MSDKKPKKSQKLRARLPRGLVDRTPAEIAATRQMVETIREVYERYGFEPVETPAMEYTDALGKFLPDQDRPNEGVFSFQDDDEQWISLRYDLTAPLARYVAQRYGTEDFVLPYRSYRHGYVYRNEKPGPGRFRQFMQFDADTVGSASPAADAEMCMMAADTMEKLGIGADQCVVKINNRKVLDGIRESERIVDEGQWLTVLRAIDKADKFQTGEIIKLLGPGRWDGGEEGRGDFTKGAGLNDSQINTIINFIGSPSEPGTSAIGVSDAATLANMRDRVGNSKIGIEGIDELEQMSKLYSDHYSERIKIDPSVIRGLEYYTGPVYEVELLLATKDEKGRPVRFGSVGGGGRYDGLVSRFIGQPVPATGFSIGVSRLQAALQMLGQRNAPQPLGPVVVTVMDPDRMPDYQQIAMKLRNEGIRAEIYLGKIKGGLGAQLKYAVKRNAPCVVIQGSDEKMRGEIIVKDMNLGASLADDSADRVAYLQRQTLAQFSCPEQDLLLAVNDIIQQTLSSKLKA